MPNKWMIFLTLLFLSLFVGKINAQANNPHYFSERFVVQSMLNIQATETTYQAISSDGNYGLLNDLRQANFIDSALASGDKYGYTFTLVATNRTASTAAKFYVTATPRLYPKTGRRSFYIDESGEMHGANKAGASATVSDPIIDSCAETKFSNEKCVIQDLRTLHGAQMTYQATAGNGNFGSLTQLRNNSLITQRLASGTVSGYNFAYLTTDQSPGSPAAFKIYAAPVNYGVTGTRPFYIATDGVLRGADKNGERADENDPPIEF